MNLESATEKVLFSTIRVETKSPESDYVVGTAFVFEYRTEDNTYPFLVTTRNLIEKAQEGRITLIQAKNREPLLGKSYTLDIENFSKLWFCHPNEEYNVAVTPFVPFVKHVENSGVQIYFDSFNEQACFLAENYSSMTIGKDVLTAGYPKNCWDDKNLLPVFKQGMVSLPFSINFQGQHQGLIDCQVSEGMCGSPVFCKTKFQPDNLTGSLLGVLSNLPESTHNDDGSITRTENVSRSTSMGVVIKIHLAIEAINAYLREKGFI